MMRLSNYSIFVDLDEEETLLVHGYSGAWDIVTADVAARLRGYRAGPAFKPLMGEGEAMPALPAKTPPLAPHMRDFLVKRGHLTRKLPAEEQAEAAELAGALHGLARQGAPSYVFTLSYACNLACAYCFQDSLRADPAQAPRLRAMSHEMVDTIFAAMPEIEARHGFSPEDAPERRITLFGGEPLLAPLRPIVRYIIDRARADRKAAISAISNGTDLHHFTDLIGPDGISFIQITLDGGPEEHDRRRIGHDRAPTFHRIADNIDLALGLGAQIKLRINTDRTNGSALPELARFIEDRGWFDHPDFSAYATPVHETSGSGHEACGFGSWALGRQLVELGRAHPAVNRIEGPDAPWERRVREVIRGTRDPLLSLQPSFCGAHTQTWVFDALGDIYACWERAGYEKERIGRLGAGGTLLMDQARETAWRGRTVASNPVCGRCPYAFYCGGGCALLAEQRSGQLHSNYCDGFSQRFKALAAAEVNRLHAVETIEAAIAHGVTV